MADANDPGTSATEDDLTEHRPPPATPIPDYSTLPHVRRAATPMGVVAVVAVKVVGLYCLVQGLPLAYLLPTDLYVMIAGPDRSLWDILFNLVHPVFYIVAGLVLIRGAEWVATRVLGFEPMSEGDRVNPRGQGRALQAIAFSVAGVWFVVTGLTEIVRLFFVARYYAMENSDDVLQTVLDEPSGLAAAGAQLALGVWLFFGSKRLAAFWHRFRMRSRSDSAADAPIARATGNFTAGGATDPTRRSE